MFRLPKLICTIIGVLTKPDLLQEGEEEMWFRLIKGERLEHPLKDGYRVSDPGGGGGALGLFRTSKPIDPRR